MQHYFFVCKSIYEMSYTLYEDIVDQRSYTRNLSSCVIIFQVTFPVFHFEGSIFLWNFPALLPFHPKHLHVFIWSL